MSKLLLLSCLLTALFVSNTASGAEGFWKTKVGELDFYSIQDSDGEFDNSLFGQDNAELLSKIAPTGKTQNSCTVFVVKKGDALVMFDTGMGRNMIENLKKADIDPASITDIVLTHTHGDHVGGFLADGKPNFPNAKFWIGSDELAFWKTSNTALRGMIERAYDGVNIIFDGKETKQITPLIDIKAIPMPGHTPGHLGFMIESGDEKIVVAGDVLHSRDIQFAHPEISARFDRDVTKSVETRIAILERAAGEKWRFAATHVVFPSVGKVSKDGDGFKFEPEK